MYAVLMNNFKHIVIFTVCLGVISVDALLGRAGLLLPVNRSNLCPLANGIFNGTVNVRTN